MFGPNLNRICKNDIERKTKKQRQSKNKIVEWKSEIKTTFLKGGGSSIDQIMSFLTLSESIKLCIPVCVPIVLF